MLGYVKYIIYEQEESLRLWLTCRSIDLFTVKILFSYSWYLRKKNFKWPKKLRSELLLQQNLLSINIEWKWNKRDFQMYSSGVLKTRTRDASGTLTGPYKNQRNGTLAGPYKSRKTRTRDPSGTFRKSEKREPGH